MTPSQLSEKERGPIYEAVTEAVSGRRRVANGCRMLVGLAALDLSMTDAPHLFVNSTWGWLTAPLSAAAALLIVIGLLRKNLLAARALVPYLAAFLYALFWSEWEWQAKAVCVLAALWSAGSVRGLWQFMNGMPDSPSAYIEAAPIENTWALAWLRLRLGLLVVKKRTRLVGAKGWLSTLGGVIGCASALSLHVWSLGGGTLFGMKASELGPTWISLGVIGVALLRVAQPYWAASATEAVAVDSRPPVLFLRSFKDDSLSVKEDLRYGLAQLLRVRRTFEEVIAGALARWGPVLAVGRPGEELPPVGASREYLEHDTWLREVQERAAKAIAIVVVLGRTAGLRDELQLVARAGHLRKVVLLIPPVEENEMEARWKTLEGLAGEIPELAGLAAVDRSEALVVHLGWAAQAHVLTGRPRRDEYAESVRIAFGLALASDSEPPRLREERMDTRSRALLTSELAVLALASQDEAAAPYWMRSLNAAIFRFRGLRGFRTGKEVWSRIIPPIGEERLRVQRPIDPRLLGRTVIELGTNSVVERMPPEAILGMDQTNWRLRNTMRLLVAESSGEKLPEVQDVTFSTGHWCSFCKVEANSNNQIFQSESGAGICARCTELTDDLLYDGKIPEPNEHSEQLCSFCQTTDSKRVLFPAPTGEAICLSCAEAPLVQPGPWSQGVQLKYHRHRDLGHRLVSDRAWQVYWALSRVVQVPNLLRKRLIRESTVRHLGHSEYDVRARALELCCKKSFRWTSLLEEGLSSDRWLIKANSARALSLRAESEEDCARVVSLVALALDSEPNERAAANLVRSLANLTCGNATSLLERLNARSPGIEQARQEALAVLGTSAPREESPHKSS